MGEHGSLLRASPGQDHNRERRSPLSLFIPIALTLLGACTLATLVLSIIAFSKSPFNEERIAPAVAWAHGINIYQQAISGPLLSVLYGPMFYVIYWPVTLFRHVTETLVSGTVWSLVLYSLPVAYYVIADRKAPALARTVPILIFFALPLASYWSTHVMLAIHPDAAACGLAGLGIVLVAEFRGPLPKWRIAIGILLCIAATACKQNAVLGLPILLTIIWWRTGRKHFGFALAVTTAGAISAVLIFTALYGNIGGIWFNNYVIPRKSGVEWSKSSAAVLTGC